MLECLNIQENITTYDFIYNLALNYDKKEYKTCLILPTERNVRYIASCGLKYVELYTISNFFDILINIEKKVLPKELRPFYLKKAIKKLTLDEITAVFKSGNQEFLESFIPFAENSKNIFSFYRELFSEMVDIKDLAKAGKYSDYENQINILYNLWNIYTDLLHENNWVDKYETYQNTTLNDYFINNYDNYIFLISGFIPKHEMIVYKKIGETKNVTIVFNYVGKRQSQHKEYESFFQTNNLQDKTMPVFSSNNIQIFSCSSNISQIELITKKAFELNIKHSIPFEKMAVIMPDTSCKTYFINLDYYNIFDVSAGRDIVVCNFYSFLNNVFSIWTGLKTNKVEISKVINIFLNEMLQKDEGVQDICKKLYKMIDNSRLYIEKDELYNESVVQKYLLSFFNAPTSLTISQSITYYRTLLKNIMPLFVLEQDYINETIILLDKLEIIYKNIDDVLLFEETSYIILNEISKQTVNLPKKDIAVTGILESRNISYDVLFMPYMTEEFFPPKNVKDMFINTEIRNQLKLPTFVDRENLMKNYLYQLMSNAKITIISYSNDSTSRRSSFIEELAIKNNLKELIYTPKNISLIQDKKIYNQEIVDFFVEKNDKIIAQLKDFTFSASNINIYKSCSLRFYLQYILKIDEPVEELKKLNNQVFGNVIHSTFKNLFDNNILVASNDYLSNFKDEFLNQIKNYDAYKYSNVEQFITNFIVDSIPQIVKAEKEHAEKGYIEKYREHKINIKFNDFNIMGYIDKIEMQQNNIVVTDYKFKDNKNIKQVTSNNFDNIEDIQLPIYCLLIDKEMGKIPSELYYFCLKDTIGYIEKGFNTEYYSDFKEYLHNTLKEIVDINIPFIQTDKIKNCNYCSYNNICGRQNESLS